MPQAKYLLCRQSRIWCPSLNRGANDLYKGPDRDRPTGAQRPTVRRSCRRQNACARNMSVMTSRRSRICPETAPISSNASSIRPKDGIRFRSRPRRLLFFCHATAGRTAIRGCSCPLPHRCASSSDNRASLPKSHAHPDDRGAAFCTI